MANPCISFYPHLFILRILFGINAMALLYVYAVSVLTMDKDIKLYFISLSLLAPRRLVWPVGAFPRNKISRISKWQREWATVFAILFAYDLMKYLTRFIIDYSFEWIDDIDSSNWSAIIEVAQLVAMYILVKFCLYAMAEASRDVIQYTQRAFDTIVSRRPWCRPLQIYRIFVFNFMRVYCLCGTSFLIVQMLLLLVFMGFQT